ncbi:hypothetical protein K435DRAFT_798942 [Dendrothele bispora CBS 962.96]|uniref:Uncharacterized protein n=1 Tax=Dendrothele bispora (strain CBS 962.96) TaxID=1314807 RepID=A0A4S8LXI0_DENBC|nr:hypothetical protein K435DRAFT_798942 [Dendrothele bispora CBS 962.96]
MSSLLDAQFQAPHELRLVVVHHTMALVLKDAPDDMYADVAALRSWGYKKGLELVRRMSVFRGALTPAHPQFAQGSKAAEAVSATGPVAVDAPKVQYTEEDDKAIDKNMRQVVGTSWHSGIQNLKVADMSIPPSNVNANTYSTAIAIGEKAALIIRSELQGICLFVMGSGDASAATQWRVKL